MPPPFEHESLFSGRCVLVNGPNTRRNISSSTTLNLHAKRFELDPRFNESVRSAKSDETCGLWRVKTVSNDGSGVEYICRWVVVASGENAEKVVPEFEGLHDFGGNVIHACDYKSGEVYRGKRVLVVGCGNSGMEVSLDLCHYNAIPSMVVRNSVHVLPREIFGKSTFELGVSLMKWMPICLVDKILLASSRLLLGNIEKYGLKRPSLGPLQLKNTEGKTLYGSWVHSRFSILNLVTSSQESEFFSRDGFPVSQFPNGLKGKNGLYAVGFSRRGLSGASLDAIRVAQDIGKIWKTETKQKNHSAGFSCHLKCKQ
ncbi:hypothetical protein DH2020_043322 [Rehmannia glutinosa]|uniref:Flavin-containing monooxygenase n=1 Tax=Rehmannia glutinosa TaxID=99300 RepID=A0ABR0UL75_REHGL